MTTGFAHRPVAARDATSTWTERPRRATQTADAEAPRTRISAVGASGSPRRRLATRSGGPHAHEARRIGPEEGRETGEGLETDRGLVTGEGLGVRVGPAESDGFAEADGIVSSSRSDVEHAAATETSKATREVTPQDRTE